MPRVEDRLVLLTGVRASLVGVMEQPCLGGSPFQGHLEGLDREMAIVDRADAFNPNHYVVTDVEAEGTAQARTTTIDRQPGGNLVTAVIDGLSRRTEYTCDTTGHVLTVTRFAVTPAVTTTFTYEPLFFQMASVTDPLSHTWTMLIPGGVGVGRDVVLRSVTEYNWKML
jgi:YD repeat-containing protein